MKVSIRPELERFAEERANRLGYRTVEEYLNALVEREKGEATANRSSRIRQTIQRMSGSADAGYSTDEIMGMTRDEESP